MNYLWVFELYIKNREVYRPEILYEGESVHIKKYHPIKQLCNPKVWDFAMAFQVRKVFVFLC